MLQTTLAALRTVLMTDQTIDANARSRLMDLLKSGGKFEPKPEDSKPRLLRRREAAQRLGLSLRALDQLCTQGVLRKIKLPGRKYGAGILESSLNDVLDERRGS